MPPTNESILKEFSGTENLLPSGTELMQKAVSTHGEANNYGQHFKPNLGKRKYVGDFSSSKSYRNADQYGLDMWVDFAQAWIEAGLG